MANRRSKLSHVFHREDNVAIALQALSKGRKLRGLTLADDIERLHKFALVDIPRYAQVTKFGIPIGFAKKRIRVGEHVHVDNLHMGKLLTGGSRRNIELATPNAPRRIRNRFFKAFRDARGRAGTRNYVLIASTVDCSAHVVQKALELLNGRRDYFAQRFANVDGIIGIQNDSGCGVVKASDAHQTQNRTLRNLIEHPNVGARLVIGLGCEKGQACDVCGEENLVQLGTDLLTAPAEKIPWLEIQADGGTWSTVEKVVDYVERVLLPQADRRRREHLVSMDEMILATQCGGSNALSPLSNAAIGVASDMVVGCGGTSGLSETDELTGVEFIMANRAVSTEVAERWLASHEWYCEYIKRGGGNPQANLADGNYRGGLTTIAEKGWGSAAKGGDAPLSWVANYGEIPCSKGFGIWNGPAFDPASATGQTAGGSLVGIFSTGQGSCFGGILVPWIKVVSNTERYNQILDMEINGGKISDGLCSVRELGIDIFETVVAVASGAKTYSEKVGYQVCNIWNPGSVT